MVAVLCYMVESFGLHGREYVIKKQKNNNTVESVLDYLVGMLDYYVGCWVTWWECWVTGW